MLDTARTEEEEDEQTPKKTKITQLHQHQQVDRISQLPDDILHPILSLVTLKEACITSTLSKRWRNLFPSLPRIDFDDFSFGYSSVRSNASWDHEIDFDFWFYSVCDILESRRAPVRNCTIRSDYLDEYCEDFGNIVCFLCNGGIQELTIDNMVAVFREEACHFTVPSTLYLCRTLTRIELSKCVLKVPSKFTGLTCLNALNVEECIVEDGDMHRLIFGCRAIERLTLEHCYRLRNLVVDTDNLAVLDVTFHSPLAVFIVKAPRLESVTVRFSYDHAEMYQTFLERSPEDGSDIVSDQSEVSMIVRLLESLGNIQKLSLKFQNRYMKRLRRLGVTVPVTLRSLLPKMKKLTLKMQLNSKFMVAIVSCLLNSCPKLEDLVIGASKNMLISPDFLFCYPDNTGNDYGSPEASVLDYWDQQMPSDCMRNTLRMVTVYLEDGCDWRFGIKLVKFLLNNVCVLKKLVIQCCDQEKEQSMLEDFQSELLQLRPASPDAVVELNTVTRRVYCFV